MGRDPIPCGYKTSETGNGAIRLDVWPTKFWSCFDISSLCLIAPFLEWECIVFDIEYWKHVIGVLFSRCHSWDITWSLRRHFVILNSVKTIKDYVNFWSWTKWLLCYEMERINGLEYCWRKQSQRGRLSEFAPLPRFQFASQHFVRWNVISQLFLGAHCCHAFFTITEGPFVVLNQYKLLHPAAAYGHGILPQ